MLCNKNWHEKYEIKGIREYLQDILYLLTMHFTFKLKKMYSLDKNTYIGKQIFNNILLLKNISII